jgi:cyclopropane fatty-acyl-phospholipid synthase-like methyltransferase
MQATLRAGVRVVSAHQLFPTPPDVARQVVELAGIQPGHRILEPSAGTGRLLDAAIRAGLGFDCGVRVVAVEINRELAGALLDMRQRWLYANDTNFEVRCADFLSCNGDLGVFDRIVMNPPFENGDDIRHIEHAHRMLKPGGRLASVCANGPRQRERFLPVADTWVDLPPGSFQQSGTTVNAAIVVLRSAPGSEYGLGWEPPAAARARGAP